MDNYTNDNYLQEEVTAEEEAILEAEEKADQEEVHGLDDDIVEEVVEETVVETVEEVSTDEAASEKEAAEATPEESGEREQRKPRTVTVVGVRFRTAGKSYYFSPGEFSLRPGMHVIASTARGLEYGTVVSVPMEIERRKIKSQVRDIVRIATREDDKAHEENHRMEREAYRTCYKKIRERKLDMKLIDAEYTFDHSKILFYFTADGRIDFRDLVKDLASVFKTRIELRQIGVRDETRILGGYGSCGRPLCCHTYLSDFVPVSIKMAKEQNLSLNPAKISGVCGRLMCCLKNEADTYTELNKNLPRQGDEVEGPDGLQGEVTSVNVLRQKVRILVEVDDEKEMHEYNADEITMIRRRKRGEAKSRSKRIEAGQEKAEDLKKVSRKPQRPAKAEGDTPAEQNAPAAQSGASEQNGQGAPAEQRQNRRENGGHRDGRGNRDNRNRENRENRENGNGGNNNQNGEHSERSGRNRHRRGRGHGGQRREGGQNHGGQRGNNQNSNAPTGGEG